MKCDFIGCNDEATTKGHIFGHIKDSGEKDGFLPVNACDKHKEENGFFEQTCDHDLGGICGKCIK